MIKKEEFPNSINVPKPQPIVPSELVILGHWDWDYIHIRLDRNACRAVVAGSPKLLRKELIWR